MNFKTTLILAVLVALGGIGWLIVRNLPHDDVAGPTTQFLTNDLKADALTRIEIERGGAKVILEQAGADDWSLPGKWPVRAGEVKDLVQTLTDLHSRFASTPLTSKADLKKYGLEPPALKVKVTVKGKEHTLAFGEDPSPVNRFSRATYLRLDDNPEIVRLAPGLVAALDRSQDRYQARALFPYERVAKDNDPVEKVEMLAAKGVAVKSPEGSFELVKAGDSWEIVEPVKDHVDPDKLKALLTAFPDIWAERFVDTKDKKLEDFGLKDPQTIVTVTGTGGRAIKVFIGNESETKLTKVPKPAMPQQPFMPPKQDFDMVPETYRFAKLQDNEQIFEIKADKLKDINVPIASLRDPQLARFRAADVKRLEIDVPAAGGATASTPLIFSKEKERWRMEKPKAEDAENGPINDLLEKLANLQAKDADVLDKADLKTVGLEKPAAKIKITIEEEKGPKDNKTKTTRDIAFDLGTKEKEKDKLYVKVEGWPRVNSVDDAVLKLARRPEYVYRNRKVLDVAAADVGKLEIQRTAGSFTLEQDKGTWKLTKPEQVDVDTAKAAKLAGELTKLEAVEFITDSPKDDELEKTYGLAKPALTAKIEFTDAKKPAHTLSVGKARGDKEYYARLDQGAIFVLKKDTHDDLDRDSLAYRPLEFFHGLKEKIHELAIQKDGQEYRLIADGKTWKLRGPFDADAMAEVADPIADEIANLRANRFVTHAATDLKDYGLDKPYLTVRLVPTAKDDPEHQLQIGKAVDKEAGRFAKLDKGNAIFVLSDKAVATLDHTPLDFLDKKLLAVDAKAIQKVHSAGPAPFTLEQKKDVWEIVGSPAPTFPAEEDAVQNLLRPWSNLRGPRGGLWQED